MDSSLIPSLLHEKCISYSLLVWDDRLFPSIPLSENLCNLIPPFKRIYTILVYVLVYYILKIILWNMGPHAWNAFPNSAAAVFHIKKHFEIVSPFFLLCHGKCKGILTKLIRFYCKNLRRYFFFWSVEKIK